LKVTKILSLSLAFSLVSSAFGCRSANETRTENSNVSAISVQPSNTPNILPKSVQTIPLDAAKIAGRTTAELDTTFGAPQESRAIENGGEYRLYKISGQTKGLAVRFYGGRAKSFNVILDKPFSTSKEALKQVFNIDVGSSAPLKDAKEPLSEKYQGTFGGVKFKKVSAKRQENGKGFIFVLAEVAE
jgi:hypothetical protein